MISVMGSFLVATLKSNPFDNSGRNSDGISISVKFSRVLTLNSNISSDVTDHHIFTTSMSNFQTSMPKIQAYNKY